MKLRASAARGNSRYRRHETIELFARHVAVVLPMRLSGHERSDQIDVEEQTPGRG